MNWHLSKDYKIENYIDTSTFNPVITLIYFPFRLMYIEQDTKLRNGNVIESVVETPLANSSRMAETNFVNNDFSENTDVSSQIAEHERKKKDLQSEFIQLKDLMLAV